VLDLIHDDSAVAEERIVGTTPVVSGEPAGPDEGASA
jgi:hypothetical protein